MNELEILISIKEDVAAIRAHETDILRRIDDLECSDISHDKRIRKLEIVMLPIYGAIAWIGLHIFDYFNK